MSVDFSSVNDWHDYFMFFDATTNYTIEEEGEEYKFYYAMVPLKTKSYPEIRDKLEQLRSVHVRPSVTGVSKIVQLQAWIRCLEWVLGEDE